MRRRDFVLTAPGCLSATALWGQSEQQKEEYITAAASRDTAPRIGLIPSSFTGTEEMDGRKIRGLKQPVAIDAPLTASQLDDMLHLAVELGGGRRGGLHTAIGADDWVVIKINAQRCSGKGLGTVTDPRLLSSVLRYMAARKLGRRITIAEGPPCRSDWQTSTWDNAFDGLSYQAVVSAVAREHRNLRIELVDLNGAESLEMPVEGRISASRNPQGLYRIPRILRECDKVISMAPLSTMALSLINYLGFAPGQDVTKLGTPGEVALDLFSFHPASYSIVGGTFASEAGGSHIRRHNVIIAGNSALAVDAVGAAVMGFDSEKIPYLELAVQRGYGTNDSYSIWTRGVEIEDAKAEFRT